MKYLSILALAALTLSGCATMSTAYHPNGLTGGYKDKKLAEDRYYVEFGANGYSSAEMARDFTVLRGAELCQQAGYAYFSIVSSNVEIVDGDIIYTAANIKKPVAESHVQCSHDSGSKSLVVADTIQRIRSNYPKHMPKS